MENHLIDPYPIPKDSLPRYINEPWLIDASLREYPPQREPDEQEDNIRIYVPMDLNRKAILRRLDFIINRYGEANEDNESDFYYDVSMIVSQMEIYDRIWYIRHIPDKGEHSEQGIQLAKDIIARLKDIPDGCSEWFPFDMIDGLTEEYLA